MNSDLFLENLPLGHQLEIINSVGKIVYSTTIDSPKISLQLADLSVGIYMLKAGGRIYKFQKQ